MSRGALSLGTLAAQALVLGGLVAREEGVLRSGTRVVLKVGAVDPMEFFAGRYVETPPAIGVLDLSTMPPLAARPRAGSTVYVRLSRAEPFWKATAISLSAPDAQGSEEVYLRGVVTSRGEGPSLGVDYGIGRYYIPEKARDPSAWRQGGRRSLSLVVRVGRSGRGVVEDLLVDGTPFREWRE